MALELTDRLTPRGRRRLRSLLDGDDMYGPMLFHRRRFRRLGGYRALGADGCIAAIVPDGRR